MAQDQVVGDFQFAAEYLLGAFDSFTCKNEHLDVGKIQGRRINDGERITEFVLRERFAVAIGDLSTRRGNIEHVCPRQFLCFKRRLNFFIRRRRRRRRRGRWRFLRKGN